MASGGGRRPFAPPGGTASIRGALFRPDAGERPSSNSQRGAGDGRCRSERAAAIDRYSSCGANPGGRGESGPADCVEDRSSTRSPGARNGRCVGATRRSTTGVASNGRDFYVDVGSASSHPRIVVRPKACGRWPSILSRETDTAVRGHFDLEIVWTPAMYFVVWLDRILEIEPPIHYRYPSLRAGDVRRCCRSNSEQR